MNPDSHSEVEKNLLQKYGWLFGCLGALVLIGIGWVAFNKPSSPKKSAPPPPAVQMVRLMPPPTPPPPKIPTPPPVQQERPKEEMIEQAPVEEPIEKPQEEAAPEEPPSLAVDGPPSTGPGDGFGMVSRPGGGSGGGTGTGGGGGRGGKWGWYASQVQAGISEALQKNNKTRVSNLRVEIRVWVDANARIVKAVLAASTGDPALDGTITEDVLNGLKLKESPPEDMPMPIVLRITAKRPG